MKPLAPGDHLGPYEILDAMTARGLQDVYRARDTRAGTEVSIKVLPGRAAPTPDLAEAYARAIRAATLIEAGLVTVFDVGAHDGVPYVVFELMRGERLSERLRRAPLGAAEALDLARQLARGLALAHERGLVHADLLADNVFVSADGRARVLDLGLTGTEEAAVPATVDPGLDLAAWGRLTRQMLGGREPRAVRVVVERSLAGDRSRRFPNAHELVAALERATEPGPSWPARGARSWAWWAAGLLAAAATIGAALGFWAS